MSLVPGWLVRYWWVGLITATLLVAFLYWLLVLTEGAYLGPRVVVAMYDRYAGRYDRIKQFDAQDEIVFLGRPVIGFLQAVFHARKGTTGHRCARPAQAAVGKKRSAAGDRTSFFGAASGAPLAANPHADAPLVLLDVAAGTGRLAQAMALAAAHDALRPRSEEAETWLPTCHIVALDRSLGMLRQAQKKLVDTRWPAVTYLQHDAAVLPFAAERFAVVACLEALEFMPDPVGVLGELMRVLRSGGFLIVTNRVDWQARLMPGKTFSRAQFASTLRDLGAVEVRAHAWQVDYELVTACKPVVGPSGWGSGSSGQEELFRWAALLCCPECGAEDWLEADSWAACHACGWQITVDGGIWRHFDGDVGGFA